MLRVWTVPAVAAGPGGGQVPLLLWGPGSRAPILSGHRGPGATVGGPRGGLGSREWPTAFMRFSEGSEGPGLRIYPSKLGGCPPPGPGPSPSTPPSCCGLGPWCPACLHLCWHLMPAHSPDSVHSGRPLAALWLGPASGGGIIRNVCRLAPGDPGTGSLGDLGRGT